MGRVGTYIVSMQCYSC